MQELKNYSGFEIKEKISDLRAELYNSTFVFNPEAQKIQKEIFKLKENCPHEFINDKCIYCGTEKEE